MIYHIIIYNIMIHYIMIYYIVIYYIIFFYFTIFFYIILYYIRLKYIIFFFPTIERVVFWVCAAVDPPIATLQAVLAGNLQSFQRLEQQLRSCLPRAPEAGAGGEGPDFRLKMRI